MIFYFSRADAAVGQPSMTPIDLRDWNEDVGLAIGAAGDDEDDCRGGAHLAG